MRETKGNILLIATIIIIIIIFLTLGFILIFFKANKELANEIPGPIGVLFLQRQEASPAYPMLGVEYQTINEEKAKLNDLPEGAYITSVMPDSPASRAGIQVSDIISKVNGAEINTKSDLQTVIGRFSKGQTILLTVWRQGIVPDLKAPPPGPPGKTVAKTFTLKVTLETSTN